MPAPPLSRQSKIPKYRKHKASGQAVVTIAGHDHYLGPHGSSVSRLEYDRLVGEFLANGRTMPDQRASDQLTVAELCAAYWGFAKAYYHKDGRPTGSIPGIRVVLQLLRGRYGHTAVQDFGPRALKALQQYMVDQGQARTYANDNLARIKRIFRWGVSEELVDVTIYQAIATVTSLRKDRTTAREPEPVGPVSEEVVNATIAKLHSTVADMVRLQRLTGARPSEICLVRPCDIDRTADVWEYRPLSHKTQHHGRHRVIFIGPKAQAILLPYLLRNAEEFCFSPTESETKRKKVMRTIRKSKVQPSQRDRSKRSPKRKPGSRYTSSSYRRAIHRACGAAKVDPWSPNRLRHSAATEIRRRFGLEAAQVALGHASANVSQIYAERDFELARRVMTEAG